MNKSLLAFIALIFIGTGCYSSNKHRHRDRNIQKRIKSNIEIGEESERPFGDMLEKVIECEFAKGSRKKSLLKRIFKKLCFK